LVDPDFFSRFFLAFSKPHEDFEDQSSPRLGFPSPTLLPIRAATFARIAGIGMARTVDQTIFVPNGPNLNLLGTGLASRIEVKA
jgi:hypothetical protein